MKKLLIILFLTSVSLVSCTKDYSCTCTTTVNGNVQAPVVTTYHDVTKSTARTKCFENATTTSGGAYNKTTDCVFN